MAGTVQGTPCRRCGGTERYPPSRGRRTGACVACKRRANGQRYATPEAAERTREAARRWLSDPANARRNRLNNRRWSAENRDAYLEASRRWRREHQEHARETCRRWREENRDRAREASLRWARENPEKATARSQRRRARKLRAMPDWLSPEQRDEIEAVYAEARRLTEETGVEHHVDHIVPLKGRNVRGLHVPWNLKVVTAEENLRKGNRLDASV
ncbi:MAG: hypothetical protein R3F54_26170, partial [Alphaproteobacteria bacterium]